MFSESESYKYGMIYFREDQLDFQGEIKRMKQQNNQLIVDIERLKVRFILCTHIDSDRQSSLKIRTLF